MSSGRRWTARQLRGAVVVLGIGFAIFFAWLPVIDRFEWWEPPIAADGFSGYQAPVEHDPLWKLRPFRPLVLVATFMAVGLLLVPSERV